MNRKRTSVKSFAINTLLLNIILGAALIYASTRVTNSYGAYKNMCVAIPSVVSLVPCWIVGFILFKKERLNEGILALTYLVVPVTYCITIAIIHGFSWSSLFFAFFFSFIPTFIAYMLLVTNVTLSNND